MFAQVHYPESLSKEELDEYLLEGWFRNGQRIFTTNFLNFDDQLYSAIWLRINIHTLEPEKGLAKLAKLNAGFTMSIQQASITPEKEALFQKYKTGVTFSAAQSLQTLLYGDSTMDIFPTLEITLFDNGKLIALGYFDTGLKSVAGIISFYDPEYKKNSLGKYLILLKLQYCKDNQFDFFYPGYFAPYYPAFDYKLQIGRESLSYLRLENNAWESIDTFVPEKNPYQTMVTMLTTMEQRLKEVEISGAVFNYTFFEANIIPTLRGLNLFDFPVFLSCFNYSHQNVHLLIVYDVIYQCYHLVECKSVWKSEDVEEKPGFYSGHLLKMNKHVCSTKTPDEMAAILAKALLPKQDSNS